MPKKQVKKKPKQQKQQKPRQKPKQKPKRLPNGTTRKVTEKLDSLHAISEKEGSQCMDNAHGVAWRAVISCLTKQKMKVGQAARLAKFVWPRAQEIADEEGLEDDKLVALTVSASGKLGEKISQNPRDVRRFLKEGKVNSSFISDDLFYRRPVRAKRGRRQEKEISPLSSSSYLSSFVPPSRIGREQDQVPVSLPRILSPYMNPSLIEGKRFSPLPPPPPPTYDDDDNDDNGNAYIDPSLFGGKNILVPPPPPDEDEDESEDESENEPEIKKAPRLGIRTPATLPQLLSRSRSRSLPLPPPPFTPPPFQQTPPTLQRRTPSLPPLEQFPPTAPRISPPRQKPGLSQWGGRIKRDPELKRRHVEPEPEYELEFDPPFEFELPASSSRSEDESESGSGSESEDDGSEYEDEGED